MDSEEFVLTKTTSGDDHSSKPPLKGTDEHLTEDEDPYSLNSASLALFGAIIGISTFLIPFLAVLIERDSSHKSIHPTALQGNGFKSSISIPIPRISQPDS